MADTPISAMPVANPLTGSELNEVVQDGENRKTQELASLPARVTALENTYDYAAIITNSASDVPEGGYPVARLTPSDRTLSRFYGEVLAGAGSAIVHVLVDEVAIYGPIEVAAGAPINNDGLSLVIPADSRVTFDVAMVDDVQGLWLQIDNGGA